MKNTLFSDNIALFDRMLKDIEKAKRYIYLETYRFNSDEIGNRFRKALVKKAKEGIEVKLLLDSWGSSTNLNYFKTLIDSGGEVRFFRKLKYGVNHFHHNHKRDHRKILVIDDEIAYIGSTNICKEVIDWRELNVRFTGNIALIFRKAFLDIFEIHHTRIYSPKKHTRVLKYGDISLIRDVPSGRKQKVRDKFVSLIRGAKKNVIIETPYFIIGRKLRKALKKAVKKGVKVKILLPLRSDVKFMDLVREQYFGYLYRNGIEIHFFEDGVSHGKGVLVDGEKFMIGSANLDYRTFIWQYEIVLAGENKDIAKQLRKFFKAGLKNSIEFNYDKWKTRHFMQKAVERAMNPFRRYL